MSECIDIINNPKVKPWAVTDSYVGLITNFALLIQTSVTFGKVSCNTSFGYMKNVLLCMFGQTITGIIFSAASLGWFSDGYDKCTQPLWNFILTVFGLTVYWVCIYMTTWLVAFKYWETSR